MNKNLFTFLLLAAIIFVSCKKEANTIEPPKQGRFVNKNFSWDYESEIYKNKMFVGDLNYNQKAPKIYPGGVYPKDQIDNNTFEKEYPYEKNPFDYYFNFTSKFIVEDLTHPYGKGLGTYYKAENQALESQFFKDFVNSKVSKGFNYNSVEVYTYSDIEKYFNSNPIFGKNFTSKMGQNKKRSSYKSLYFARIEREFFDITFEPDYSNFFLDKSINEDLKTNTKSKFKEGNPYYIKNMVYGSYAYLAIESEYPYLDVKRSIENLFTFGEISTETIIDQKTEEILSKSAITIMTSYNNKLNTTETNWANDINAISPFFSNIFHSNYIGVPIFIEIRDVLTNSTYHSATN